jgi:DNA/RNA endonuclease YhcR with UshA esterase domain
VLVPSPREVKLKSSRFLLLSSLLIAVAPSIAQSVKIADAKNHLGETGTVCGKVVSERTATGSNGHPTFINLDNPYPNQTFTIVIWEEDRQDIGELPAEGSRVCATGKIRTYHGVPEIVVRSVGQLSH